MRRKQLKQALLPKDCVVLPNDVGTAPGCVVTTAQGKMIMMFPGPPSELKPMLYNYAVPFLQDIEQSAIYSDNIHVFGKGEGAVAEEIAAYIDGQKSNSCYLCKRWRNVCACNCKSQNQRGCCFIM